MKKKKTTKPKTKKATKNSGNERQEDSLMRQGYREGELERRFGFKRP